MNKTTGYIFGIGGLLTACYAIFKPLHGIELTDMLVVGYGNLLFGTVIIRTEKWGARWTITS